MRIGWTILKYAFLTLTEKTKFVQYFMSDFVADLE